MDDFEYKKEFSQRLNYFMCQRGKTQADITRDLGISSATISNWCTGLKLPRMSKIQMLADYLGVNRSDLIEGQPSGTIDPSIQELINLSEGLNSEGLDRVIEYMEDLAGNPKYGK